MEATTLGRILLSGPLGTNSLDLLFGASKQSHHNSRRNKVVVLMKIRAERSPVVIKIDHPNLKMPQGVDIDSAANLIGHADIRRRIPARPADRCIGARSTDQPFYKRCGAPTMAKAVEVPDSPVISIQYVLSAADRHPVVAAICDDLQPWLYIPAKRSEHPV